MSTHDVYLGRDNALVWELLRDGETVEQDAVSDARLWIPGSITESGDPIVAATYSEDGLHQALELTDNATKVEATLGSLPLRTGQGIAALTIYDSEHPDGIAWARIQLRVHTWPVEADDG